MTSRLADLIDLASVEVLRGDASRPVRSITADSRRVEPGDVFVAIAGPEHDGHQYIEAAVAKGATVVVLEADQEVPGDVAVLRTEHARRLLGRAVRGVHGAPDRRLQLVAVTGTNGKTSVAHVVCHLLRHCGVSCGLLGTIEYDTGKRRQAATLTTPGVEQLYELFSEMVEAGLTACAMEASSHALDQERLGEAEVDVAAFLNLTRDHLDYHVDESAYLDSKLRLLERLEQPSRIKAPGRAIVNGDDPVLASVDWPHGTVFVGSGDHVDLRLVATDFRSHRTHLTLEIAGSRFAFESRLLGAYNAQNLLVAIAVGHTLGLSAERMQEALPHVPAVPGRLEPVELEGGPLCLVDYAHTPDGLEKTLQTCRDLTRGRIVLVFGCGGDRDRGKRSMMMAVAQDLADAVIFTLDNPRTEDPEQIAADAWTTVRSESSVRRIDDRQMALAAALESTGDSDLVLVAGKGHEAYQLIGRERLPWDDRRALRTAWEART